MAKKPQVEGLKELQRDLNKLDKGLTGIANRSARAGGTIIKKKVSSYAPVGETEELKKGFVTVRERRKVNGKAVYQVVVDPKKSDIFAKISNKGKRSYYPASQEYGFKTVNGGYIPGYRYMRRAANDSKEAFEKRTLEIARKAVDKALAKKGVK